MTAARPRTTKAGGGKRPVINVSWDDITREYLPWLNEKLGLSGVNGYRLLTDGEWEYAARAGTTSRYAFGNTISRSDAQFFDGPIGAPLGNTAETGSFAPNAFGLHDMHGNVAEWVQDCFSFMNDAADLPTDGSALDKNKWLSSDRLSVPRFSWGQFCQRLSLGSCCHTRLQRGRRASQVCGLPARKDVVAEA